MQAGATIHQDTMLAACLKHSSSRSRGPEWLCVVRKNPLDPKAPLKAPGLEVSVLGLKVDACLGLVFKDPIGFSV